MKSARGAAAITAVAAQPQIAIDRDSRQWPHDLRIADDQHHHGHKRGCEHPVDHRCPIERAHRIKSEPATCFHLPEMKQIDRRLVLGAAIFGVGWGLSGFCPGPAITSLPLLAKGTLVFVPAMLCGMIVTRLIANTGWLQAKTLVPARASETH